MPFNEPVDLQLLRQFKSAANGYMGRDAAERIIEAILDHFGAEITAFDSSGFDELFRVGRGSPSHGIHGIHIHPLYVQHATWDLKAGSHAVALTNENFNMYLGTLLLALETGRFRCGLSG